jgi:biotin carboxyl carrier protein
MSLVEKIINTAKDAGNAIKNTATSTANKIANTATSPSTINTLKSAVRSATSVGLETGLHVAGSTVRAPYVGTVLSPAINKAADMIKQI